MNFIQLKDGQRVFFNKRDSALVSRYSWVLAKATTTPGLCYARAKIRVGQAGRKVGTVRCGASILMHHLILPPRPGFTVDHRDGDGLNNRRSNLRYATHQQQKANCRPIHGRLYKGITFYKRDGNWRAQIGINGQTRHIGYFSSPAMAAIAYNREARKAFGNFAKLNKVHL